MIGRFKTVSEDLCRKADLSQMGSDGPSLGDSPSGGLHAAEPEGLFNVANLASDIAFRQPPDLPFADHVHRLIAGNGSQRPIDGPEPQSDRDSSLEESVVLLEHIVLPVGEHPSGFPAFCARSVLLHDASRPARLTE